MMMYEGNINAEYWWYIVQAQGSPPVKPSLTMKANRTERKLSKKRKRVLIAIAVLFLVVLVTTLIAVLVPRKPVKQMAVQLPWFFPYTSGDVSNYDKNGTKAIPLPANIKWRIFGDEDMEAMNGFVHADQGYLHLASGRYRWIMISVSRTVELYDRPDITRSQYFIMGNVASSEDKSLLSCLIYGAEFETAFVYTWINFTLNGTRVGDFQIVLAFAADSTVHIIRIYSFDVIDHGKSQFSIWYDETDYNANQTAADVRGTRQVFAISESPVNEQIVELPTMNTCGLAQAVPSK